MFNEICGKSMASHEVPSCRTIKCQQRSGAIVAGCKRDKTGNVGNDNTGRKHVEHVDVRMYVCTERERERQRVLVCDVRRFYFYDGHGQKIALQVTCDDSWLCSSGSCFIISSYNALWGVTTPPPLRSPMLLLLSPKGAIGGWGIRESDGFGNATWWSGRGGRGVLIEGVSLPV